MHKLYLYLQKLSFFCSYANKNLEYYTLKGQEAEASQSHKKIKHSSIFI